MEKYLKMSDFVVGDVSMSMNHNGDVSVQCDYADPDMIVRKTMDAMEHAINSHDELVAMNKELLEALEAVIEWYDMEADHSIEPDFYKRMASCQVSEDMAREAIAKAKAAS
jgi:hypothetical protein